MLVLEVYYKKTHSIIAMANALIFQQNECVQPLSIQFLLHFIQQTARLSGYRYGQCRPFKSRAWGTLSVDGYILPHGGENRKHELSRMAYNQPHSFGVHPRLCYYIHSFPKGGYKIMILDSMEILKILLAPASFTTTSLAFNFCPTWTKVKSVLAPCLLMASSFNLNAKALSLGKIFSLCKLPTHISTSIQVFNIFSTLSFFAYSISKA